jgi:hypothetical protein
MVVVRRLRGLCRRRRHGEDYIDPSLHQLGGQGGQPVDLILGPAIDDREILALDIARPLKALAKRAQTVHDRVGRPGVEDAKLESTLMIHMRHPRIFAYRNVMEYRCRITPV